MKEKKITPYFLLLFISLIACFNAHADISIKMEGVVMNDGKAVPAAIVSLYNAEGKIKEVLTNSTGYFSLNLKANDEYNVFITKAGFSKSEIVVSTLGFSDEEGEKIKGISKLEIEIFELPSDEASIAKIKEILSTPILSFYYDFDKNSIVSDESLEDALKDELPKLRKIVGQAEKKVDVTAELELKYKNEIIEGDKLYKAKNYELASLSYQQASSLKPDEAYPKSRLAEIDKLATNANEKELALLAEKERLAKEKELKDAAEKERLAKAKAAADEAAEKARLAKEKSAADAADKAALAAAEKERLAKERAMASAAERERLDKEKAIADAAEKERLAKIAAAEQERLAKEKAIADAAEKVRLEKEKAAAELAEKNKIENARLAKEKAIADAAEKERLAKEKAIADAAEKERLAKEEAVRVVNKKYTLTINTADSAMLAKNYTIAKAAYNNALVIKPQETYPKGKIAEIDLAILKSGDFKNDLANKYPQGITEEIVKEGNAVVTRRIVVIGNKGVLYIMRRTSFGTVYYFEDDKPITEAEFKKNTETK